MLLSEVKVVSEKLTDEIKTVKGDSKKIKYDLKSADNIIENLDGNVQITKEQIIISDNNLKYLINVDRNSRRCNVIIFGVKENEDVVFDIHKPSQIYKNGNLFSPVSDWKKMTTK